MPDGGQPYGAQQVQEWRQHFYAWRRHTERWTNRRFASHGLLLKPTTSTRYPLIHGELGTAFPLLAASIFHSIGVLIIYLFPSRGVLAICHLALSLHQFGRLDGGINLDCEQSAPTVWACATPVASAFYTQCRVAAGSDIIFLYGSIRPLPCSLIIFLCHNHPPTDLTWLRGAGQNIAPAIQTHKPNETKYNQVYAS